MLNLSSLEPAKEKKSVVHLAKLGSTNSFDTISNSDQKKKT
jgi:hypothetical protein